MCIVQMLLQYWTVYCCLLGLPINITESHSNEIFTKCVAKTLDTRQNLMCPWSYV